MSRQSRSLMTGFAVLLLPGCMTPMEGQQHSSLDVELVLQVLSDVDYLVTNYSWILALIGL